MTFEESYNACLFFVNAIASWQPKRHEACRFCESVGFNIHQGDCLWIQAMNLKATLVGPPDAPSGYPGEGMGGAP
jgi:hypothetical protein